MPIPHNCKRRLAPWPCPPSRNTHLVQHAYEVVLPPHDSRHDVVLSEVTRSAQPVRALDLQCGRSCVAFSRLTMQQPAVPSAALAVSLSLFVTTRMSRHRQQAMQCVALPAPTCMQATAGHQHVQPTCTSRCATSGHVIVPICRSLQKQAGEGQECPGLPHNGQSLHTHQASCWAALPSH